MIKRKGIVCLILVLAISFAIPTQATSIDISENVASSTPWSIYFGSSCVYLADNGNCSFDVWFEVTATKSMKKLGASHIKIQESLDGTNWTTVRNFYSSAYPNMLAANTAFHASSVHYTGMQGRYYRAVITLYAELDSGSGQTTEYTQALRLQY